MIAKDILSLRLEAITSAQQRSRNSFFAATVAAVVVLIVSFNVTFSQVGKPDDLSESDKESLAKQEMKKEEVKHYFDRFYYSLPLVGVQISTDDLVFFAPLALLIFSLYYVSCMRSTYTQLQELRQRLGLANDSPDGERISVVLNSEIVLNTPSSELPFTMVGPRWLPIKTPLKTLNLYQLLIFLPALACLAALYADIHGTYVSASALGPEGAAYFTSLSLQERIKVLVFEFLGLIFSGLVALYCVGAARYAARAREIIASLIVSADLK